MTTPARRERQVFAETLLAAGPDAPTLCDGWTTRDLAAHIIARDRRPDSVPGIAIKALSGHTKRIQDEIAAGDWSRLVSDVRDGPRAWSPTRVDIVERAVNTAEFFVHHEDVLRAQPGWQPRDLDADLVRDLHGALRRSARLLARKSPAGIVLRPDGHPDILANARQPAVVVSGPVPELLLWIFGRQANARVEYEGPDDLVAAVRTASFGI